MKLAVVRGALSHLKALAHEGWGAQLVLFGSRRETLVAVRDGVCDAALHVHPTTEDVPDDLGLSREFVDDLIHESHVAVHRGDQDLLSQINRGLAMTMRNGAFDRAYAKWIGPIEPHPIRLHDLRPYWLEIATGMVVVLAAFHWLRRNNRVLAKQAAALRQSQDLLLRTGDLAKIGGWEFDVLEGKIKWTRTTFQICEWEGPTEPTLEQAAGLFPRKDWAKLERARREAAEAARPYDLELRVITAKGRPIWVRTQGFPVRSERGVLVINGTFQDITLGKQAEDSLVAAAQRLAVALETSKLGVWRYDLLTLTPEWDERMFAIFGVPVADRPPPFEVTLQQILEPDREAVSRVWNLLPEGGRNLRIQFRIMGPQGKIRHLDLHGVLHLDLQGRPASMIGVVGDITEIVEASAEAERLRTQLQQSQKMEALGSLAAGVAHDFNNLLTGINGFVELASTSLPPGHEAHSLLKQARNGAMSARDLVQRILSFSRGQENESKVLLDAVRLIRETEPLIRAAMPARIEVQLALSCAEAPVLADSSQLQRVLMNLCTNAAHAIGDQMGAIKIGAARCKMTAAAHPAVPPEGADDDGVLITVEDNGCGMDRETRKRIFERFFTTKKAGEGTGLGLAIVQSIVCGHDGRIELESELGRGTRFMIYLPLSRRAATPTVPLAGDLTVSGRGQRILVVDDEAPIVAVVRLTLKKIGYSPEGFTSPTRAWECFAAAPDSFGLLMIDRDMPEITGPEFIARARAIRPNIPVVMMSGRFDQQMDLAVMRVHTLAKPFEIGTLGGLAKAALEERSGGLLAK
jgi:signal transduction histidine kinase